MTPNMKSRMAAGFALAVLGLALSSLPATAQDRGPRNATRAELEERLATLQTEALTVDDRDRRDQIRNEVDAIGYRLREGDVWEGDVISLAVAGEADWTGSFTVTPRRTIELDGIDPIDLSNLLYSELKDHMTAELGRYLREPRVEAEALKRLAILGGVGNPGYMSVSGEVIVSDLIMQAGGPTSGAQLDKAEFKRNGKRVGVDTGPIALQHYSLDQLGIRSGDELHIPIRNPTGNFWQDFRVIVFGLSGVLFALSRIF